MAYTIVLSRYFLLLGRSHSFWVWSCAGKRFYRIYSSADESPLLNIAVNIPSARSSRTSAGTFCANRPRSKMAEEDDLEGLEALHHDLQALSEARLPVVERLRHELAAKLEDFRKLLDKEKKKESSRQALNSGIALVIQERIPRKS